MNVFCDSLPQFNFSDSISLHCDTASVMTFSVILQWLRASTSCSWTFLQVSPLTGEAMNASFTESPQFNFSDFMSLHCNMVSVVIFSIVMSSFSKCPSISPFLKKIASSDKLRRTYGMHSSLVISTLYTVGIGSYPFVSQVWSTAKSIRGSSISRSLFSSNISQRSAACDSVSPKSKLGHVWESSFTSSIVSSI